MPPTTWPLQAVCLLTITPVRSRRVLAEFSVRVETAQGPRHLDGELLPDLSTRPRPIEVPDATGMLWPLPCAWPSVFAGSIDRCVAAAWNSMTGGRN